MNSRTHFNLSCFSGKTALVTGASSGIGRDMARILGHAGAHVIAVARRESELATLKLELHAAGIPSCELLAIDLTQPNAVAEILKRFPKVDILINNAGFGIFGDVLNYDRASTLNMIDLNIRVLTELTLAYLPYMRAQNMGYILNVASIAAYQACPLYAAYGATKSYVLHFTEALHQELKDTGISACALSPGITATSFFDIAGQQMTKTQRFMMMKSEDVARLGLEALARREASYIPGRANRLTIFFNRVFPRSTQRRVVDYMMRQQ